MVQSGIFHALLYLTVISIHDRYYYCFYFTDAKSEQKEIK